MWCLWALPLLGLAVPATAKGGPPFLCNNTMMSVEPPLWVKSVKEEAHFFCSPGFKLQGQKILTCTHNSWDHQVPSCEELPRTVIKMKCPFDHREWSVGNLDNITDWISHNSDNVIILNREFIEDTPASQRLAAEMLWRFNDPFFQFYGDLITHEKSLPMKRLIQQFQQSFEFLQLLRQMRDDFPEFQLNDIDEEENVLLRHYGLHFVEVLQDIILPYRKSIPERSPSENITDTMHTAMRTKTPHENPMTIGTLDESSSPEPSSEGFPSIQNESILLTEAAFPAVEDALQKSDNSRSNKRSSRDRGDIEKFLPERYDGMDYFNRPFEQVLQGHKAALQEEMNRRNYIEYLKSIVKHIITYGLAKKEWPEFLRQFEIDELRVIPGIPDPAPPVVSECSSPRNLGFELISNGRAYLEGSNKITIRCDPGFVLHGSQELFCERGRWMARAGSEMPICISQQQTRRCEALPAPIANGRIIKAEQNHLYLECLPGFTMRGPSVLLCTDGVWTPSVDQAMPVCYEKQTSLECGTPPPTPPNGLATEPHFMADQQRFVVRYFCNEGYSMVGDDYSFCFNRQWTPYTFRCVRGGRDRVPGTAEMPQNLTACQKLVIPNGSVKYYADDGPYARVTCLPGYRRIGPQAVYCVQGIFREPIPRCQDSAPSAQCSPAAEPLNGYVKYATENAVRYYCDRGYYLAGRDRATCFQGRWSNPAPNCVPQSGCQNDEPIRNRNLVAYVYNNGRWLECFDRVQIEGAHRQLCRNGRWDAEPVCLAAASAQRTSVLYPEVVDCPLPENPQPNEVTLSSRGQKIFYRCKRRDATLRGEQSNECVNGQWLHRPPSCVRSPQPTLAAQNRCLPRAIPGGEAYVYSEGRIVHYQCRQNYLLRGRATLRCESLQWSDPVPACYDGLNLAQENGEVFWNSSRCLPAPSYPKTTVVLSELGLEATYSCANRAAGVMRCQNSVWIGRVAPCDEAAGVCEPPEVINGKFFQYRSGPGLIQCKGNYVIQNTTSVRNQTVLCDPETGKWDFGLSPPECVADPGAEPDERPFNEAEDFQWKDRHQVDDCGPPQISSNFVWYVEKDGRTVALGCRRSPRKRSVGSLACTEGTWKYTTDEKCDPDTCGLADLQVPMAVKIVYARDEYVFQCNADYELVGPPVAHCPGYRTDALYNLSLVQEFGNNFVPPRCEVAENDLRPISQDDDFMPFNLSLPCSWLSQFGNVEPGNFTISDRGRKVTVRDGDEDTRALCKDNGEWLIIQDSGSAHQPRIQVRDKCSNLPTEPDHGTFFLYGDPEGTYIYFQCLDAYRLYGPRISNCSSAVQVPDCVYDPKLRPGLYPKQENPNPDSVTRCRRPPETVRNGEISVHRSGEMFAINCNPGFVIENTRQVSYAVNCDGDVWKPERWPRCLRDGDRDPLPSPASNRDYFGRLMPQRLTGVKAENRDAQLREQFRSHTLQLAEFAKARNRELRQSGYPPDFIRDQGLPIIPLPTEERDELFQRNELFYREIEALLNAIKEERVRSPRKSHFDAPRPDGKVHVPAALEHLEPTIRELNLSQQDTNLLLILGEEKRAKFLEEKRLSMEKSKSDPVQSQAFLQQAFASKNKLPEENTIDDKKLKSAGPPDVSTESTARGTLAAATENALTATEETSTAVGDTAATTTETLPPTTEIPATSSSVHANASSEADHDNGTTSTVDETTPPQMPQDSSSSRKGFDDSCAYKYAKAPEIQNGFVVSYEIIKGPDGKVLQANYRCYENYYFEFEHTATVRCRNGEWVGELPSCIEEDDDEDTQDSEEYNSQSNNLS